MKVLITGGLGNVGQWAVKECVEKGYEVSVYELETEKTMKKYDQLSDDLDFQVIWGDLTNADHVKQTVEDLQPDVIIHIAAVLAPIAYVIPEIAYNVNIKGSGHLLKAAEGLENLQKFIFVSSYSVHGPRNPHTTTSKLTGGTPTNPQDNYGRHKVWMEQQLQASALTWTIIRLPAVFPVDKDLDADPNAMKFLFILDPDRNTHGIDARDAGFALANAVEADTTGRIFDIAGDPKKGWSGTGREITGQLMKSRGLGASFDSGYRRCDPEVDESWYYEDWVDPSESQEVLQYQRISFQEHLDFVSKQMGFMRYILKLIGPIINWQMKRNSPYQDFEGVDSGTTWDAIKEVYDMEVDEDLMVY